MLLYPLQLLTGNNQTVASTYIYYTHILLYQKWQAYVWTGFFFSKKKVNQSCIISGAKWRKFCLLWWYVNKSVNITAPPSCYLSQECSFSMASGLLQHEEATSPTVDKVNFSPLQEEEMFFRPVSEDSKTPSPTAVSMQACKLYSDALTL